MENDNFTVTWICSTFEEKSEGKVLSDDIYNSYSVECHKRLKKSIECIPKNNFMKILLILYPRARTSYVRVSGGRKYMYKGICYHNFSESNTENVQLTNIQNYLDESCILMSRTVDCAKICMKTEIFTNGNMLFKEITLDFSKNKWLLRVSGKVVDFSRLGISDDFDQSEHNLNAILVIVKSLKICTGIDVIHKKTIPTFITAENISFSQDENKMLKKMRCSTCKRVLNWLTLGDACYTCRKNLNLFKNTGQKNIPSTLSGAQESEPSTSTVVSELVTSANTEMLDEVEKSQAKNVSETSQVKQTRKQKSLAEKGKSKKKKTEKESESSTSTEVSELVTSTNTQMLEVEESQAKNVTETSQKTVKQTRKRKCLAGKGKSKKEKTENKWPCGICGKDASNYSVGCDGCDQWFHADCLKIDSLDTLPDDWYCNNCLEED